MRTSCMDSGPRITSSSMFSRMTRNRGTLRPT